MSRMLKLSKSLIVNADEILQVHPQIEVKVHHIINVWENDNDKIESSVEMVDYTLHSFMGEPLLLLSFNVFQCILLIFWVLIYIFIYVVNIRKIFCFSKPFRNYF
jgi:hypothetical protein